MNPPPPNGAATPPNWNRHTVRTGGSSSICATRKLPPSPESTASPLLPATSSISHSAKRKTRSLDLLFPKHLPILRRELGLLRELRELLWKQFSSGLQGL